MKNKFFNRINKMFYFFKLLKSGKNFLPSNYIICFILILSVLSGIYELVLPFIAEYSIDNVIFSGELKKLKYLTFVVTCFYGFGWVLGFVSTYISYYLSAKHANKIRNKMLTKCLNYYKYNDLKTSADYAASIEYEVTGLLGAMFKFFETIGRATTLFIGAGFLMLQKDFFLVLIILLIFVLHFIINYFFSYIIARNVSDLRDQGVRIFQFLYEILSRLKSIYLSGSKIFFKEYHKNLELSRKKIETKLFWIRKIDNLFSNLFQTFIKLFVGYYLGKKLMLKEITGGDAVFITLLLFKLQSALAYMISLYKDTLSINRSSEKLYELINMPENEIFGVNINEFDSIEFKNVFFNFGINKVINNLSFNINKGQKVIIFGESGSGKTTIFNLMAGIIKQTEGDIFLNGINISDLSIKDYFNIVSFIPQESDIFPLSLKENIILDKKYDTFLNCMDLSEFQQVYDNYNYSLKNETYIDSKSIALSNGEQRRLVLTRGLINNSEVIVIDEPDANLGDELSKKIIKRLFNLKDKTVIIFTHRQSLITFADTVIQI